MRQLQFITSDDEREQAADSLGVELMTLLMAVKNRVDDDAMSDEEPAAVWPVLDFLRRILDETELGMMQSMASGRKLQEAADLTDGRYPTRQSFHRRRLVLDDKKGIRRTLTMDYRRGAAVPKPSPELAPVGQQGIIKCTARWGVCPEHGNSLRSSEGQTWCKTTGCGRTWDYDRVQQDCAEPAAYDVHGVDEPGNARLRNSGLMCAGHALDARIRIVGVKMTAL